MEVNFKINIKEKNTDSYLSAGEMPLPALYQVLSLIDLKLTSDLHCLPDALHSFLPLWLFLGVHP